MKDTEKGSVPGYAAAVIVNAVIFYLLPRVPGWNIPFITGAYADVLPILLTSTGLQIAGNGLLLFFRHRRVYYPVQIVFSSVTIAVLFRLITVFPFDFTAAGVEPLGIVMKVIFGIGIFGSVVSILVNAVKLGRVFLPKDEAEDPESDE